MWLLLVFSCFTAIFQRSHVLPVHKEDKKNKPIFSSLFFFFIEATYLYTRKIKKNKPIFFFFFFYFIEVTYRYTRKMEVVEARRMNQNHKKM